MTINWEVIIWTCITLAVLMSVIGRIMFAGGVYGKVVSIDDEDTLRVEVAPKVVITISRYAVQSLLK